MPPAQLPTTGGAFTGGEAQLARLDALLPATPGSGPTTLIISALAVAWARRVAHLFPDVSCS